MAELPPDPDSNVDTGDATRVRPDRESPPSTPRWVKVFAIITLVLVLLFVVLHLTGRGFGGHAPSGGYILHSFVTEYNVRQLRL